MGDDDSTTRSLLVKKTDKNKGQLPDDYPGDIIFWADVNHRVKCMVKPLFALAQLSDSLSCCKKDDCLRIKRNFGWYFQVARKDPQMTLSKFVKNAKAPIEHHFHNHQWCDASWCPFKEWDDIELKNMMKEQEKIENKAHPICVDPIEVDEDDSDDAEVEGTIFFKLSTMLTLR